MMLWGTKIQQKNTLHWSILYACLQPKHSNGYCRGQLRVSLFRLVIFLFFFFNQNNADFNISLTFIFSQHIVFGMTAILAWIIPDVPKEVDNQIKRENFLAREALRSSEQHEAGSPEPPEDDML